MRRGTDLEVVHHLESVHVGRYPAPAALNEQAKFREKGGETLGCGVVAHGYTNFHRVKMRAEQDHNNTAEKKRNETFHVGIACIRFAGFSFRAEKSRSADRQPPVSPISMEENECFLRKIEIRKIVANL